jgi:hypothetical protein
MRQHRHCCRASCCCALAPHCSSITASAAAPLGLPPDCMGSMQHSWGCLAFCAPWGVSCCAIHPASSQLCQLCRCSSSSSSSSSSAGTNQPSTAHGGGGSSGQESVALCILLPSWAVTVSPEQLENQLHGSQLCLAISQQWTAGSSSSQ